MKKTLALLALLPTLALAQGLQPAEKWSSGNNPGTWAGFSWLGGIGNTEALALPLVATGGVIPYGAIPDDENTVMHFLWDGFSVVEVRGGEVIGSSWTMNGQVPQVAANAGPFTSKAGAGPYSADNNYEATDLALGEWTGDWSATVIFWLPALVAGG